MDFQAIYDKIRDYALGTQTVESFYIGDPYMNFNSLNINYAAFNVQINNIRRSDGNDIINFQFCWAGKLLNDSSNLFILQSNGYNAVINVIRHLKDEYQLDDYSEILISPFFQQFSDILAGVWCDVNIYIPIDDVCEDFDKISDSDYGASD